MKKEAGETDLADPLVEMPDGKHDYNLKTYVNSRAGLLPTARFSLTLT